MIFRDGMTGRTPAYRLLQTAVRGAFRLTADFRVTGAENFPADGPYLLVMNHLHFFDIPIVFTALPNVVAGLAAAKWQRRTIIRLLTTHVGNTIYIKRSQIDMRAIARARAWLDEGGILLIAPEGTRSRTGTLQQGLRGTAYLANRSGAPVVPVVTWGQERLMGDLRGLRRGHIDVRVGPPLEWTWNSPRARGAELDAFTDHIMATMAGMLPEEYRGAYAAVDASGDRPDPDET